MSRIVQAAWWVGEAIQDRESSVMAVTAGLGSGKTHGGCQWHHQLVRENSESRFSAFMEPTYQKVMDTAIPTYQKVLQALGRAEGWHYKVVKSPFWKIIYRDHRAKHEVHFISGDRPDLIAGVEYSHASEDEAGVNKIEARRNLRTRLYRDPAATRAQYLIFGAPQGVNEFAEEFDSETVDGWIKDHPRDHHRIDRIEGAHGQIVQVKKRRFILWTDDNPFIRPEYIAELMSTYGHNPYLIQSYRYGRFCPLVEGAAYKNYAPQKHDIEDIEPSPHTPIQMCWDFNANPLAWVSMQRRAFDEPHMRVIRWIAHHEANQGAPTLDESCIEFAVKHPLDLFRETPILLYGDPSGHSGSHKIAGSDFEAIEGYLRKLGYRNVEIKAQRAHGREGPSVDAVNKMFLNDILKVCKRCRMLRKGLMATTWKKSVRKIDKPKGETHTHHPEALKNWAWQERDSIMNTNQIWGKN